MEKKPELTIETIREQSRKRYKRWYERNKSREQKRSLEYYYGKKRKN